MGLYLITSQKKINLSNTYHGYGYNLAYLLVKGGCIHNYRKSMCESDLACALLRNQNHIVLHCRCNLSEYFMALNPCICSHFHEVYKALNTFE
jgi:hypothetical protein